MTTRNEEIQQIHRDYTNFYQLGGGVALVLLGVFIGALIFADDSGYGTNIYTEILSVGLTILVLNGLQERRDNRNRIKDLQEQLVREAGSPAYAVAITAVDTMRKRGWLGREDAGDIPKDDTKPLLENGDLSSADLHSADLENANLTNANLKGANLTSAFLSLANLTSANLNFANLTSADFWKANLTQASLARANLTGAQLRGVNLTHVHLQNANLTDADLRGSDMSGANLWGSNLTNTGLWKANLTGANLVHTNLTGANLNDANLTSAILIDANLISANLTGADLSEAYISRSTKFDETTILPDGSNWSSGRNLAEFGAETRKIMEQVWDEEHSVDIFTFADGTKRRYQPLKGWLDDRDGNPIESD